jgi:hypothetical protein
MSSFVTGYEKQTGRLDTASGNWHLGRIGESQSQADYAIELIADVGYDIQGVPPAREINWTASVMEPSSSNWAKIFFVHFPTKQTPALTEPPRQLYQGSVYRFTLIRTGGIDEDKSRAWIKTVRGNTTTYSRVDFVSKAEKLIAANSVEAALDLIYDRVEELLCTNRLFELDEVLRHIKVRETSLDTLISMLTTTLPVRGQLSSRKRFFNDVKEAAHERGELDDSLLAGLED